MQDTQKTDPTAFLTARLDEKEAEAKETLRSLAWMIDNGVQPPVSPSAAEDTVTRMTRALREVAAMRRILAEHAADDHWCARPPNPDWVVYEAGERIVKTYPCGTARDLAAIWNDHPDYDPDWKP